MTFSTKKLYFNRSQRKGLRFNFNNWINDNLHFLDKIPNFIHERISTLEETIHIQKETIRRQEEKIKN